jgi:Uma2 family endonuclease
MITLSPQVDSLTDFLVLPETKPASEYINGRIIQKPMPQGKHSLLQLELISIINSVLKGATIAVAFPELRCTFGGRSTVPDVAVFKYQNIAKDDNGEIANAFTIAPDWVVEILSPEQSSTRVIKNIIHCLNHGTAVGWLIDPEEQTILIYRPDRQVIIVDIPDEKLIVPDFASSIELTLAQVFNFLKLA